MILEDLKPPYTSLPPEHRLRLLEYIRANRMYPTGRMCNYLNHNQRPQMLQGDTLEFLKENPALATGESDLVDSSQSVESPDSGLLSPVS